MEANRKTALGRLYSEIVQNVHCKGCPRLENFKPGLVNEDPVRSLMLIFESPGYRPRMKGDQMKALELQWGESVRQRNIQRITDVSRKGLHQYWVMGGQRGFFRRFFDTLAKSRLISFRDVDSYMNKGDYWQDFFITDAALCPGERKTLGDATVACRRYISEQIDITNPKLIIPFGNEAFRSLKILFGSPRECLPQRSKSLDEITDCHGYLLQCGKFRVLPLVHLSREYMTLRESYFDFLLEGLKAHSKRDGHYTTD